MRSNISTVSPSIKVPTVSDGPAAPALTSTGAGVVKAADAAFGAVEQFELARQEAAVSQAQMEARRQLDDLAFEAEKSTDTDFEGAGKRFETDARAISNEAVAGLRTEREQTAFTRRFSALSETRRVRVRDLAFGRARDGARATLTENLIGLARDAASAGDPRAAVTVGDVAAETIDAHAQAGWISREQAARLKVKFRSDVQETAMRGLIVERPGDAVKMLRDKKSLDGLDPDQRLSLLSQAKAALARDEARARAAEREIAVDLRSDLREIVAVSRAGLKVDDQMVADVRRRAAALGDKPIAASITRALDVVDLQGDLIVKTPLEVAGVIRDLTKAADTSGAGIDDAAKITAARQVLQRMRRDLDRDPLAFARSAGVVDVAPLDFSGDGDAVVAALAKRRVEARRVAEHYGIEPKFFTRAERAALGERLNNGSMPERQGAIAQISMSFGEDAAGAFEELGQRSPALSYLGQLTTLGPAHQRTLDEALTGLEAIKNKTVVIAPVRQLADLVSKTLDGALDARFADVQGRLRESAVAVYAGRAARAGITDFSDDLFKAAVRSVAGAHGPSGAELGGIGQFNGRKLFLPQHMDESDFSGAVAALSEADLTALSLGRGAPMHRTFRGKSKAATPEDFRGAFFVTVRPGGYQVSMTDPEKGAPEYLVDANTGGHYVLDFSDPGRTPTPQLTGARGDALFGSGGAP